jgi:hypothetical protein
LGRATGPNEIPAPRNFVKSNSYNALERGSFAFSLFLAAERFPRIYALQKSATLVQGDTHVKSSSPSEDADECQRGLDRRADLRPDPHVETRSAFAKTFDLKRPQLRLLRRLGQACAGGGFPVEGIETVNVGELKARVGVPQDLAAFHTAQIDGYVIEGHVPAAAVKRLLKQRPTAKGLATPRNAVGLTRHGSERAESGRV